MPPAAGPKRKRSDKSYPADDVARASPHRPDQLDLAKQSQSPSQPREDGGRTTRRQSRGGRNSTQNAAPQPQPTTDAPTIKSPTPTPAPADVAMTNGQTETADASSERAARPPRLFPYEHITDEIAQSWEGEGREKIKARLIDLCQIEEDITLDLLIQELVESATTSRIDTHDAGLVIKEAIASTQPENSGESASPIQDALLGAVSIIFADEDNKSKENSNPHVPELAIMLAATDIAPDVMRIELDAKLMEQLGLIRTSFHRQVIRKQTNLLYRQANYNLLREESEGFSKLVTELFTTSGNEAPHGDVVEATVEKVKAMIGAFDLDVGRSLDVVLDVFGSVLVKQYRFFVKFLRASPWWPRTEGNAQASEKYAQLGGLPLWALPGMKDWRLSEDQRVEVAQLAEERDVEFWNRAQREGVRAYYQLGKKLVSEEEQNGTADNADAKQQWIKATGTMPHLGSSEAAQLLGFKLRFYAPGAEGDGIDGTPRNLIYLAALLIKIGFISLHDLYPHLWRPDSEMDKLKGLKQNEKEEREKAARPGGGASNALANAGALADDTASNVPSRLRDQGTRASTPSKDAEPEKPKEAAIEKPDQKVLLLQSLLAIGALPEALFILGQFPWMMELIPELPEYLNRILHHSLSRVYENARPLNSRNSLQGQKPLYETDQPGIPKGQAKLGQPPQRRVLRWPLLDREDSEVDGINYRFYWDEWNDNIPVCRTVDDVFVLSKTLLPLVGAKIGHDVSLVLKFTRIGKVSLREDDSSSNRDRWLDLIKRVLLPSLSLTKPNPGAINEVFDFISLYPTETRYIMYLDWLKGRTSRTPDLFSASKLARDETKDVLKRISKTNVKPMARALAKIAYANPHIVIDAALPQIESYDSIANSFVEGTRYFTDLGYDVLTWSLVSAMQKEGRLGVQADGMFTSKWLTAIAHFIGKIYKRYGLMKPGPILQYVARQLDKGITIDLITLEQIVVSMAGIAPDANFNDAQLLAMGGGPLLQSQTLLQLLDQRHESKVTAKRLVRALQDYGLTAKLLLTMARQRQACIFDAGDAPLKAIGYKFDEITRVMGQYLDMLKSNLTAEEFGQLIPGTATIMNEYEIPAEVAFAIGRAMIQKQMNDFDRDDVKDSTTKDVNGDIDMKDGEASEEDGEAVETEDVATGAATPTENEITGNADADMAESEAITEQRWHPVLRDVMDETRPYLPEDIRDVVGPGFYVTFWQLSLYDINVPSNSYQDEMNRNKKKITGVTSDRSNVSSLHARNKEAQIKGYKQFNDDLLAENRQHLKAYSETKNRLTKEKDQWFAAKSRVATELNVALMEHCFLPRILFSPLDAYFCFKFAKLLHTLGAANFRTLGFYDLLFKPERLTSLIFMCTSKESDNLGKFLAEVLKDLARWHKGKETYEREAFGSKKNLPGFALKVENGKPQLLLDYEKFRTILFKWHSNLHAALVKCLMSPEYMHVRNAISILRIVSPVFPAVDHHGRVLQKSVDKLRESDREDLKVASQALLGALSRRQKAWIQPQAFREGPGIPQELSTATPDLQKEDKKKADAAETGKSADVKMRDAPAVRNGDRAESSTKDSEKTPSVHSRDGRSPSRTGTPLPPRPPRDTNSLRPPRPDSRAHDLPRRVSPPPRFPSSSNLPSRPEVDSRNSYRDNRPPRGALPDPPRPDSRTSHSTRHAPERMHESSHDPAHRYPRPADRPSMLDRDERPPRREHDGRHDPRAAYEERRYNEREPRAERGTRPEREPRPDRDPRHERESTRPTDRDHGRHAERPERSERDYGRPAAEHSDRRRDDGHSSRRDEPPPSRTATPSAQAPDPAINPARAALIQNNDDSRPSMSIRGQAQDRARSSRPPSPKREDDRRHVPRSDRDDRHERRPEPSIRNAPQAPSPANSRTLPPSGPPTRETRGHGRGPVDMSHGRLEQDTSQRPGSRMERASEAEPPSGPRSRPPRQSLPNADSAPPPRPAPQNRQPPSGPSGHHTRNNSYVEPTAMSPSGTETSGIHPDRMNRIAPAESARNQRQPPPPPLQTSPPAGPRANAGPPTGPSAPSPSTRGPPSGPQAESGRGQRHPMAAVNSTLAQAAQGPRGPAGRGRGGMRQNSISYSNQMPPSPVGGPGQGFNGPSQQDLINNNPNGMPIQPRGPSGRQDSMRDDDRRPPRAHQQHDDRDRNHNPRGDRDGPGGGYNNDDGRPPRGPPQGRDDGNGPPPRSGPRGYPRGPNPNGDRDGGAPPSRKHPRDENASAPYGGGRGGRVASEAKRPRRGG
ncbi:THO2 plays a role in transcriptional elongation [Knufia fluminis]|uniref:THO complex subunit 2 n=1 Tax=Knufia fluminis TaxID=191047 RepID=A0AAN8EL69_9EURO|nr:THO2 plays a role in transcriptional elongation [Knufia fluminis]